MSQLGHAVNTTMSHVGHVTNTTMMMVMANVTGMHHSHGGHNMTDHSGHNMTDHSGHDMTDHSGHDMPGGMDHGTHAGDHTLHGAAGHTMQMYFHTGVTEYILFESLLTSSKGGLIGACFAMFALSVLYEGLKYFREYLLRQASHRSAAYAPSPGADVTTKEPEVGSRMLSGSHGVQTLLHMVQVFISYCLMLVFMTYNVWLCISIIIGAGFGYFLFGWRRAMVVDINEHCH